MLPRIRHLARIEALLRQFQVVGLIGPRQVGKTTLAREIARRRDDLSDYFDLEDPVDRRRLDEAVLSLEPLTGLVIIDEIQHRPDLFPYLRVLADRDPLPARFLVLGSASPDLLKQSSESLAGRIAYHELTGLALDEVGGSSLDRLWSRGGFPRAFVADNDEQSFEWRRQFVRTYVSRDLSELGSRIPGNTMHRFWTMLAHWHGQLWNGAELARSFGVNQTTVRRYLDLLTSTFVVRQLQPWHENLSKRQVRSPKVYVGDSGVLHALLDIHDRAELERHPKLGASWEGLAIEMLLAHLGADSQEAYFWATHQGAELDLLIVRGTKRRGFEIKRTAAPRRTRSMQVAMQDLQLDNLDVIHAGSETFALSDSIRAVPLAGIAEKIGPL